MFYYSFPNGIEWPHLKLSPGIKRTFTKDGSDSVSDSDIYKGEIITKPLIGTVPEQADWCNGVTAQGFEDIYEIEQYKNGQLAGHAYYVNRGSNGSFGISDFTLIAEINRIIQSLDESEILVFIENNWNPTQIGKINIVSGEFSPIGNAENGFADALYNPLCDEFPKMAPISIIMTPSDNFVNANIEINMNGRCISRGFPNKSFSDSIDVDEQISSAYGYSLALLDSLAKVQGMSTAELVSSAQVTYFASHKKLENLELDFVKSSEFMEIYSGTAKNIQKSRKIAEKEISEDIRDIEKYLERCYKRGVTLVISDNQDQYDGSRYPDVHLVEKGKLVQTLVCNDVMTEWILKNMDYVGYLKQEGTDAIASVHTPNGFIIAGEVEITDSEDMKKHISRVGAVTEILNYINVPDRSLEKAAQDFFDTTEKQEEIPHKSHLLTSAISDRVEYIDRDF